MAQPHRIDATRAHRLYTIKALCRRDAVPYREALADAKAGKLVAYRFGEKWLRTTDGEWRCWRESKRVGAQS